ncbi:MAG: L-histidine N(alpha)-methyltransferase [Longimicrobiales bacterium]
MLDVDALREEVGSGLKASPPTLPPKLFYDEEGARLFEKITRVPEYYLSRTEMQIFFSCLSRIAEHAGPGATVVEFGSGNGEKAGVLLRALREPLAYVPVDIAREQLDRVAARIDGEFPRLRVLPLVADFTHGIQLPEMRGPEGQRPGRPLLFFPGSTIGNFEPEDARGFLRMAGESLGPGAALVIGFDLVKARGVLEAAYDDAEGVTAAFNVNALRHLNRLLHADFRLECFRHRAVWNPEESRIEMHLVALADQVVTLPSSSSRTPATRFRLRAGDHLVTEHSYKYTLEGFRTLADEAGWETVESWTDPRRWFAVGYLEWRHAG